MSRRALNTALAAPLLTAVLVTARAPEAAALTFAQCEASPGVDCAALPVPLDRGARYPAHVEALLLDSLVPANGPDPLALPSFRAMPAVLSELCSSRACAGISASPLRDIARLARRLRKRALRGVAFDGAGQRSSAAV